MKIHCVSGTTCAILHDEWDEGCLHSLRYFCGCAACDKFPYSVLVVFFRALRVIRSSLNSVVPSNVPSCNKTFPSVCEFCCQMIIPTIHYSFQSDIWKLFHS